MESGSSREMDRILGGEEQEAGSILLIIFHSSLSCINVQSGFLRIFQKLSITFDVLCSWLSGAVRILTLLLSGRNRDNRREGGFFNVTKCQHWLLRAVGHTNCWSLTKIYSSRTLDVCGICSILSLCLECCACLLEKL